MTTRGLVAVDFSLAFRTPIDPSRLLRGPSARGIPNGRRPRQVVKTWWSFFDHLAVKFNDGYNNIPAIGTAEGYPLEWLEMLGYNHTA